LVKLRGKFNPTTKRKVRPNLQWVKIPIGIKKEPYKKFAGKRILACTKCIKALAKRKS
jgi:ribosomal protein L28